MAITNPVVNKVFNDLEDFRDFCRFENNGYSFDEAALYNERHPVWIAYKKHQNYLRAVARANRKR
jgi:hypothetical protein